MGIDQARRDGPALKIDSPALRPGPQQDVRIAARLEDFAAPDHHRLGAGGTDVPLQAGITP